MRIADIVLDNTWVSVGTNALATLTLSEEAPAGGVEVVISGAGTALEVPRVVFVPAGQQEVAFEIEAHAVDEETSVTLKVRLGSSVRQRTLKVMPVR